MTRRTTDHLDEMQAHVELYVEQLIAQGRSPEDARREARIRFGNARARVEEIQDAGRFATLGLIARDARYAVRVLRRSPAFALTAVVTLALAIGANAAVFSLADALLVRSLPYPDPDRLAVVSTRTNSSRGEFLADYQDGPAWEAARDRVPSIDVAASSFGTSGANLVVAETAVLARQQRVGAGYFRVLGVAPVVGREFTAEEDVPNGPAVALLSHRLWQQAYGGRADILSQSVLLRGEPYTVVGVMPADFESPGDPDLWTPLRPSMTGEGAGTNYRLLARLRPGSTWAQADGELAAASTEDVYRFRGYREGTVATQVLQRMDEVERASVRQPVLLLAAGVGVVLLVACVNLAALLLARGAGRAREIGTRMALGSGRLAVVRQLMVEAAVLALAGAVLGLLVGALGLQGLKAIGDSTFGDLAGVTLDARVIALTLGLSALTSVVFGLAPALQASRMDVRSALGDGGSRSVAGGSSRWPRRVLVVAEVALGVVLLVTAGLLVRTFVGLRSLDPGFEPRGLVTTTVSLQDKRYESADAVNRLFDDTLRRLRATPGIESAAVSLGVPYTRLLNMGFALPDDPGLNRTITNATYVTPDFAATFRLPIRRGRDVSDRDTSAAPPVVLVNESWVRFYSKDREPIGRRIRIAGTEREIVGVTGDIQQVASFSLDGMTPGPLVSAPLVLMPAAQTSDASLRTLHTWFWPVWTVRASSAGVAGPALHQAIREADALLPPAEVQTMTQQMGQATERQRLLMTLIGLLAAAALLLSAVGIHGLIAQAVGERRREFGIRLALGATPAGTMWRVAAGGVALALVGAVIGGLLSLPATRLIQSFLWGVSERDPMTYAGVAAFMLLVAFVASVLPALKLLRLDPAETLR